MNWHHTKIEDLVTLQKCAENNLLNANNYSAVNSFLYSLKYDSLIAVQDDFIFEQYFVGGNPVFSFPHHINGDRPQISKAIQLLAQECKNQNHPCVFRNITKAEKDLLVELYPNAKISEHPELGDYIYLRQNLADLPGSKYSKKRNHINQFAKKYPHYRFEPLNVKNLSTVQEVEEKWLAQSTDPDLLDEQKIINYALENFEQLQQLCGLSGGLIYIEETPIAFSLASRLSKDFTDIHFEKCIEPYAHDGGYAIINKEFAKNLTTEFLNREEDLGIEGLRKAKLSYYPEYVIQKFTAQIL